MKKRSRYKKKLFQENQSFERPALIALLIAGLSITLIYKRPAHAASDRAKMATGVLFGGGLAGTIAATAGSAKWFPLGFGVGGLAAGLTIRAIRKRRARRQELEQQKMNPENQYYQILPGKASYQRYHRRRYRPLY